MNSIDPEGEAAPRVNAAQVGSRRAPLITILLCSGFVLLAAFREPIDGISDRFDERLAFALGLVASSMLLAWVVGFAIVFRKAGRGWKFGSLGIMAAVAIAVAVLRAALPGVVV